MRLFASPLLGLLLGFTLMPAAQAQYAGWEHTGTLFILTTPEGANLPAQVELENFPLLVRLHKDWFDFTQALPHGEDVRFATSEGAPLPFQIESWNALQGEACVWVRIPKIKGQARQALRVFWGRDDARGESSARAVFAPENGYLSVWHLNDSVADEAGTLTTQNVNTTSAPGMIAGGRNLAGNQGIFGGDKIANYPAGGAAHSTQAWFRAERPNVTIVGWGNEGGGRGSKVRMQLRSPPHLHIDSDFSDVDAPTRLTLGAWHHVVHTYANGVGRIYLNGELAGDDKPTLNIKNPARLWLGGWYHNYDFVGDLDEVRVSTVARSAEWIKLEYENQKRWQTLVGPLVQPGQDLSLSHAELTVDEGKSATLKAQAGGAQKLYWILERAGVDSVVAVDRLSYTFEAGRVAADEKMNLKFQAVLADKVITKNIPITVSNDVPEPAFTLAAPEIWDGDTPTEVTSTVTNSAALDAAGAAKLEYKWSVEGPAVIKEAAAGRLILKRGLGTGKLTVSLALSNGGTATKQSVALTAMTTWPKVWTQRTPEANERPVDGQFFARDDSGQGTLHYRGTLAEPADAVFLRVYAGDERIAMETQKLGPDRAYAFAVKLKAGLVKYRVEFGTGEKVLHEARDLVCGDAFLIIGQSNAVATDFGKEPPPPVNDWVRTFGSTSGDANGSRNSLWAPAVAKNDGGQAEIGYWGMELGRRLVESQRVPICLINGAVGGTRIDQHQRNQADPTDPATIYGRLLWRVRAARLTHGVRGVLWHQGENDQGADGPTGGYGWETYRAYFHDLAAAWHEDYPNLRHIHLFQIWPKACAMGIHGSDNMLREVQRTLPRDFTNMSIMSTLGVRPPGGCHFPAAGYAEFARLLTPLMEQRHYQRKFEASITPPNLLRAAFTSAAKDAITLEFDQPVLWNEKLASEFYLNGTKDVVASGSVQGNVLTLRLKAPTQATTITYLDSDAWNPDNLLLGENGLAAFTFCIVEIGK